MDVRLGTAIKLLHRRGQHDAVSLLLQADDIRTDDEDHWNGGSSYILHLVVNIDLFDTYEGNDPVLEAIQECFSAVVRAEDEHVSRVELLPALVKGDWRSDIEATLRDKPKNQATLVRLPDRYPVRDSMRFRDGAEVALYDALKLKQETLPPTETILIVPNASVRILGHTWEPDFLVTYKGRTGIIEVDGGTHRKKWADDKSRDQLLEDAGILRVERIDVEDAKNVVQVRTFVDRFLGRLSQAR